MTMVQSRMKINPAAGTLNEVHDCLMPVVVVGASAWRAGESPVMAAFREWKAAFDFVEGPATSGWSDEQLAPHLARETALVNRLVHLPARDALDVCAKLTAFTCDGRYFADDDGFLADFILRDARVMVMASPVGEG